MSFVPVRKQSYRFRFSLRKQQRIRRRKTYAQNHTTTERNRLIPKRRGRVVCFSRVPSESRVPDEDERARAARHCQSGEKSPTQFRTEFRARNVRDRARATFRREFRRIIPIDPRRRYVLLKSAATRDGGGTVRRVFASDVLHAVVVFTADSNKMPKVRDERFFFFFFSVFRLPKKILRRRYIYFLETTSCTF